MKFLVVGCGSIGERHIRNLKALSAGEVLAHDVSPERLHLMEERYGVQACAHLAQAWEQGVDALIVCVPPNLHIPVALEGVSHNAHIFLEKPLSHSFEGVEEFLKRAGEKRLLVSVGYNLRFDPGLNLVKKMLGEGRLGRVLSARAEFGQYLPDWRPGQDYRQSYTALRQMGGGIILDASHEIDYLRWLLGEVRGVSCFADHVSSLKVETEDVAQILLRFESGALASLHLDFVQRAYSRCCKLIGEEGTILWDYPQRKVSLFQAATAKWETVALGGQANDMYVEEMKHFIGCVRDGKSPLVDGQAGKRVLEIALACKESSRLGKVIAL